ncbi:thiamine-phosphate kinase [Anaeromyxobacter diazotrophicus]|uniref:Thiamine-monophosphate kinase n=1 Tax=Anaeromyxobacter diazotrophicus TaxID=2590199 RepID=A0A7I9VNE3_9BACT|nr:thiamine-phosphate kinase [Anaeromyxobacter diazotrophicus]GEJ57649.1 thiamine-monophosphate kinase [Anaeromyxobacter diazotrophicus]
MTEFELIDRFTRPAPRAGEGVVLGIGDDAAVLRPPRGEDLVVTVDAVVEGVHFDARFAPADVGWKALAVNLSDLAAMGARPLWALCALTTRRGERPARLAGVGRGLAACARAHGVALVGGNVSRARELSLTVTVAGAVPRGAALTRAGGRPGDLLFVSGRLGEAALGLAPQAPAAARARQRRPAPRLALGLALRGLATACLDVSDGLLQDLGHLCAASGVGARVELARLPGPPARAAARAGQDPLALACGGGEDYELLFSAPPRRAGAVAAAAARAGVAVTHIGALVGGGGVRLLDARGRTHTARARGHDHLR